MRVRRPHDVPDHAFGHLSGPTRAAAERLDRIAALLEPLHGPAVSEFERETVEHLVGADTAGTAVLAALLRRARAAAPLPDPTGPTR